MDTQRKQWTPPRVHSARSSSSAHEEHPHRVTRTQTSRRRHERSQVQAQLAMSGAAKRCPSQPELWAQGYLPSNIPLQSHPQRREQLLFANCAEKFYPQLTLDICLNSVEKIAKNGLVLNIYSTEPSLCTICSSFSIPSFLSSQLVCWYGNKEG